MDEKSISQNRENEGRTGEIRATVKNEKAENFWYYHKWHVLIGIAAIIFLSLFIYDIGFSKEDYDYYVISYIHRSIGENMNEKLSDYFKQYGVDRNDDGKVTVQILDCSYSETGDNDEMVQAQLSRIVQYCQKEQYMIYITDDYTIEDLNKAATSHDSFFEDTGLPDRNGTVLKLNYTPFADWWEKENGKELDIDIYIGKRIVKNTSIESAATKKGYSDSATKLIHNMYYDYYPDKKPEKAAK